MRMQEFADVPGGAIAETDPNDLRWMSVQDAAFDEVGVL